MTKRNEAAQLDELVDELGDPQPIITDGPVILPDGDQDDIGTHTVAGGERTIRTKRKAIEWGRDRMREADDSFAGLCLMFVRMCFNVAALYPDAITAWEEAEHRHRETNVAKWPRGHAGFFRVGERGHVVLCLGSGRCLTNDTGNPGTINVALLVDFAPRWGAKPLGYTDDLNGEIAPAPRTRKPIRDHTWRVRMLRHALLRARSAGDRRRAARIRSWLDDIKRRQSPL